MTLWNDLRYGVRGLRRSPGFAATAIVTLAFGIGITSAVFAVCDAILWKPVPLPNLNRLAMVLGRVPGDPNQWNALSPADARDIQRSTKSFQAVALWGDGLANLAGPGLEPERVNQCIASANFFETIGARPAMGRTFAAGEDSPGRGQEAVLSDRLWRRRFGADPDLIGKTIRVDDQSYVVIGVMAPEFDFPLNTELWSPLEYGPKDWAVRERPRLLGIGRLRDGATVAQAQAELDTVGKQLSREYPETNRDRQFMAQEGREFMMGNYTHQYMLMLFGAVLFVLLIACANVANLQFARALGRNREIAVRTALGASRRRVIVQLVTESVALALTGGTLGLLIASWTVELIRRGMPAEVQGYVLGWRDLRLDGRVLLFTFAAAVLSGILSGLTPAWQCSRPNLNDTLKAGGRGASPGLAKHRLRWLLVCVEITLSVVLLVGASLMIRSFRTVAAGNTRMEPATLLAMRVAITDTKYPQPAGQRAFYETVLERVRVLPGVRSAVLATAMPYSTHANWLGFHIEGKQAEAGRQPDAQFQAVSANYFHTLHIPLVEGRLLEDRDGADAPRVAVISQRAVRMYWPGEASPVGKRIRIAGAEGVEWIRIAGIVGDVTQDFWDRSPRPIIYVPYQQAPAAWMDLGIRAENPARLAPAVRAAIRSVDPDVPASNVATVETLMNHQATGLIYIAVMMGVFGVMALALSAIGVYGVMTYLVAEQTHEIGIRMALGASRGSVIGMVLRRGMVTTATGLAVGLTIAWVLARLMAALVWGVTASDPVTFTGIPLALAGTAALAIYVPARRATRIDPIAALRYE